MKRLAEFIVPQKCRRELKEAAAMQQECIDDVLCLISRHRSKITSALKEERRHRSR